MKNEKVKRGRKGANQDPLGETFKNLGMIEVNNLPYYSWLANEFDAMVAGRDGTIYIGENSRRAHLFIFCPW